MQTVNSVLLRFARQWVAGEDAGSAIRRARERNSVGILALINFLGEHLVHEKDIERTVSEYVTLLDMMDRAGIKGFASVKPSQLGIRLGRGYWRKQAERILERSMQSGRLLWFDMENHLDTDETLEVYRELKPSYKELGVCVQASLKRTLQDVERLRSVDGFVRVVKGAYNEPQAIAFKSRQSVSRNFSAIMRWLFQNRIPFAVATHDESLVSEAIHLNADAKLPLEYQFLLGVRNDLKTQVLRLDFPVVEYIPYGTEWLAYSYRRIREKRSNLTLLLRSFFSRG